MKPRRKLNRRSFLATVAGGVTGGGALALVGGEARAFQITDRDPTDPVGRGRGGGTGITDQDSGPGADPAGRGTGRTAPQGTGVTDSDTGPGRDPVGRGRGGGGRPQTGITDRDMGANSDPVGRGRGTGGGSSIDLPEDQRRERCENNRARLAELEGRTTLPSGWSEERLAAARQGRNRIDAAIAEFERTLTSTGRSYREIQASVLDVYGAYNIPPGEGLREARVLLTRQITVAVDASAERAELHRQIAFHRNNLIALGCR